MISVTDNLCENEESPSCVASLVQGPLLVLLGLESVGLGRDIGRVSAVLEDGHAINRT